MKPIIKKVSNHICNTLCTNCPITHNCIYYSVALIVCVNCVLNNSCSIPCQKFLDEKKLYVKFPEYARITYKKYPKILGVAKFVKAIVKRFKAAFINKPNNKKDNPP